MYGETTNAYVKIWFIIQLKQSFQNGWLGSGYHSFFRVGNPDKPLFAVGGRPGPNIEIDM